MPKESDDDQLQKRVEGLEKELAVQKSIAGFTPGQFAYWHSLGESDRSAFVQKSEGERQQLAKAHAEAESDGKKVIYKSLDGDEYAEGEEKYAKLAKKADEAEIAKQAVQILPNEPEDIANAIVRALNVGIEDEGLRAKAFTSIEKSYSNFAQGLGRYSHGIPDEKNADGDGESDTSVMSLCKSGSFS